MWMRGALHLNTPPRGKRVNHPLSTPSPRRVPTDSVDKYSASEWWKKTTMKTKHAGGLKRPADYPKKKGYRPPKVIRVWHLIRTASVFVMTE